MKIITEKMRFCQREYALKHGVTRAERRYHTNTPSICLQVAG